jgi:hypothetical protein
MQAIEIEVGQCVQWFPQGTISNPPRGGMVIEVGACGMATISLPNTNGGCDVKAMVRHMDDPMLKKYPRIPMEEGAWDFTNRDKTISALASDLTGGADKQVPAKKTTEKKQAELV